MNNINYISIVTPTFNRGRLLKNLYNSLIEQSQYNFEWIVVDDGSTDDTKNIVSHFIRQENRFNIKYFYQQNSGKHVALNKAVEQSFGNYIFIVDSDDTLMPQAIALVSKWIAGISRDKNFAGVAGIRKFADSEKIIGESPELPIGKQFIDAKNTERRKYHLLGDKAEVYKKEILIKYPFKVFSGENFLSEDSVWNLIAKDGYKIRWYTEPIYIGKYLPGGLTSIGDDKELKNFKGFVYASKIRYQSLKGVDKLFSVANYVRIGRKKQLKYLDLMRLIDADILYFFVSIFVLKIWICIKPIYKLFY